ncbi:hypothetical protein KP79_PYT13999 [Mizuhopecten yessoensis]|uniref:Uncharacterized protein n=1 Tax=Mizuhopecten yessoensis TaxID=6573 RepID=A0A210PLK4_MIZYE|nr:hypothetical protein KP79_PYT13999 [Mizuhopecten yessoensis]
MREYAVQDVTALIDLHNKMESSLTNWVEKLYERLIKVSLYADLAGVENRKVYIRDKSLLGMVANPHLLATIDAGQHH